MKQRGNNMYILQYHPDVVRIDIPKLSASHKQQIRLSIEKKLTKDPITFGKPLRSSLRNYRSLRVGDYRVIFSIVKQEVRILIIEHRSIVYDKNMRK